MRDPLGLLAIVACTAFASLAAADEDQPVVVELFTSQGCSSCPPADALLSELATKPDVLPLALHVDYWDYIGWTDLFGSAAFTRRQKAYARAAGERTIYTPQMIVGGADRVVGSRAMQIAELVQAHRISEQPVVLDVERRDGRAQIVAHPPREPGDDLLVQLVTYRPHERVAIHDGENAGEVLDYVNIVTDWRVLDTWDGRQPWRGEVDVSGPAAIIVQRVGPGAILGAARID